MRASSVALTAAGAIALTASQVMAAPDPAMKFCNKADQTALKEHREWVANTYRGINNDTQQIDPTLVASFNKSFKDLAKKLSPRCYKAVSSQPVD